MNKGIATRAYIPLRKEPAHQSEMISQLLFGETYDIIESGSRSWTRIRNHFDGYEGWTCSGTENLLDGKAADTIRELKTIISNRKFTTLSAVSSGEQVVVSAGSPLYTDPVDASRVFAGQWFETAHPLESLSGPVSERLDFLAGQFLNCPYIWGGKSAFGTDCSGLVQTIFRILGHRISRDTSVQHKEGATLNMLEKLFPATWYSLMMSRGKSHMWGSFWIRNMFSIPQDTSVSIQLIPGAFITSTQDPVPINSAS